MVCRNSETKFLIRFLNGVQIAQVGQFSQIRGHRLNDELK